MTTARLTITALTLILIPVASICAQSNRVPELYIPGIEVKTNPSLRSSPQVRSSNHSNATGLSPSYSQGHGQVSPLIAKSLQAKRSQTSRVQSSGPPSLPTLSENLPYVPEQSYAVPEKRPSIFASLSNLTRRRTPSRDSVQLVQSNAQHAAQAEAQYLRRQLDAAQSEARGLRQQRESSVTVQEVRVQENVEETNNDARQTSYTAGSSNRNQTPEIAKAQYETQPQRVMQPQRVAQTNPNVIATPTPTPSPNPPARQAANSAATSQRPTYFDGGGCDTCDNSAGECCCGDCDLPHSLPSCCCCSGGDGCCGQDRVGRRFFGLGQRQGPISFRITRGDGPQKSKECTCGYDERNGGGLGGRLASILPVSVKLRSNHCYRYTSLFGGNFELTDYRDGGNNRLISFNEGWQVGVKFGRVFENNLRLENELSYRHATAGDYSVGNFVDADFIPTSTFDSSGSFYNLTSMTNLLYDLTQLSRGGFTPYVGAGLGGTYVDGDIITPALGRIDNFDDYAFAYQLILGLSKQINNRATGFVEYRHFGTTGVEIENEAGTPFARDFPFQSDQVIFGLSIAIPNSRGCTCN